MGGLFFNVLMTVFIFIFSTRSDRRCGRIPNTTAVESHFDHLFFDARFVGAKSIGKLKTSVTGFTFVTGPPVRLIAISTNPFAPNSILIATVAARNDECYHTIQTKCPQLRHDPLYNSRINRSNLKVSRL